MIGDPTLNLKLGLDICSLREPPLQQQFGEWIGSALSEWMKSTLIGNKLGKHCQRLV
jgi:hypothetical protein